MKVNYIPLGTICSSAFVIKDRLGKRECSLPLDWVALPISSVERFIKVPRHEIDSYVYGYFQDMIVRNAHFHRDGTSFPHDIHFVGGTWVLLPETPSKFARRLTRLNDILDKEEFFLFLTVLKKGTAKDVNDYNKLKARLKDRTKGRCLFVTVNLGSSSPEDDHFNFNIPQVDPDEDPGLKEWEGKIAEAIQNHQQIQSIIGKQLNF